MSLASSVYVVFLGIIYKGREGEPYNVGGHNELG